MHTNMNQVGRRAQQGLRHLPVVVERGLRPHIAAALGWRAQIPQQMLMRERRAEKRRVHQAQHRLRLALPFVARGAGHRQARRMFQG